MTELEQLQAEVRDCSPGNPTAKRTPLPLDAFPHVLVQQTHGTLPIREQGIQDLLTQDTGPTNMPALPTIKEMLLQKRPVDREGVILLDQSLKVVAYDRAAAAILSDPERSAEIEASSIVQEIVSSIQATQQRHQPGSVHFRARGREYVCQVYRLHSQPGFPSSTHVALHLRVVSGVVDIIREVGADCSLTERETEVLRGISLGLCSKELATRMKISPNTVKVFVRLIMIKMGVTTRGGIAARILAGVHD